MFLKKLSLHRGDGSIIREIHFHDGLNLIVDETPNVKGTETGNNVGKTTVLKLVDFCLGAKGKEIYGDPENKKAVYKLVKDYLEDQGVVVSLTLKENLKREDSRELVIKRNFLSRSKKLITIDGEKVADKDFEGELAKRLLAGYHGDKPSFNQIISHNIRYDSWRLENTIKTLGPYGKDEEYETLYLYLLGCEFQHGQRKQELMTQIRMEETFLRRLEARRSRAECEAILGLVQSEIQHLELQKDGLQLNPDFEKDMDELNEVKFGINQLHSEIQRLEMRKNLILEAQQEMKDEVCHIDQQQLKNIYQQAKLTMEGIQKTFEDLCDYHNQMLKAKSEFIAKDLPRIERELGTQRLRLNELLVREEGLNQRLVKTESFATLEKLLAELSEKYRSKGECETLLDQMKEVEGQREKLEADLIEIDEELFSESFARQVQSQVAKFNVFFASVSQELYGERYAIKVEPKKNKKNKKSGGNVYSFVPFNLNNMSTGKKQGEITCFDLAYTLFAEDENIPCLHFLMSDRRELMHGNQLVKIGKLAERKGVQVVVPILKDKLPEELKGREELVVVRLSQERKLLGVGGYN